MKYFVAGDSSGWLDPLENALNKIDASLKDSFVPNDITIVHVGDLVRKGPDSDILIDLLDKIMREKNNWIQLIGNHESHFLTQQKFGHWSMSNRSIKMLKDLYKEGFLNLAWSEGDNLVTHGGISHGFWRKLNYPGSALEAVKRIESLSLKEANQAGMMLGESHSLAGPLWVSCQLELYPSWVNKKSPFIQIHGHTTPYNYFRDSFWQGYDLEWFVKVNKNARHCYSEVSDNQFVAIDPSLNERSSHNYSLFEVV